MKVEKEKDKGKREVKETAQRGSSPSPRSEDGRREGKDKTRQDGRKQRSMRNHRLHVSYAWLAWIKTLCYRPNDVCVQAHGVECDSPSATMAWSSIRARTGSALPQRETPRRLIDKSWGKGAWGLRPYCPRVHTQTLS
jgi:hypothetical protein